MGGNEMKNERVYVVMKTGVGSGVTEILDVYKSLKMARAYTEKREGLMYRFSITECPVVQK